MCKILNWLNNLLDFFFFSRFCKMPVSLFAIVFLFLILISDGEAQLNFSTGWGQGKRSQDRRIRSSSTDCSSQSASLEQLLKLYTFIQVYNMRLIRKFYVSRKKIYYKNTIDFVCIFFNCTPFYSDWFIVVIMYY